MNRGENHLSQQPIPGTRFVNRNMERAAPRFPIWPCTRWGFPCLRAYACSGGLLLHLFTLTPLLPESRPARHTRQRGHGLVPERAGRFVFCGTVRQGASRHRFPRVSSTCVGLRGIAPFGVRTFLPPWVAPRKAILRPAQNQEIISREPENLKGRRPRDYSATARSMSWL